MRVFWSSWIAAMVLLMTCSCTSPKPSPAMPVTPRGTRDNNPSPSDAFFPVGLMGVADTQFSQIASAGFNVVHEFRSIQEIRQAEDYLNRAEAVGLNVIQNMPTCRASASEPRCKDHQVEVWGEEEWARFISRLATHKNLVAWYLPDEIRDYSVAANLYKWVKIYDPQQRPVYGNPGTYEFSKIAQFLKFSDFLWVACYPEYDRQPRALVTAGMKLDARASQGTQMRRGAILQFFDSADFGRPGGYPTAHDIRSDSYQAIIGGATGLWYYSYARGQGLTDLWAGIKTVADEIIGKGGLDQVILSPPVPQTITKTILSGLTNSPKVSGEAYDSIQILQKERGGTYLFAVNVATDTVKVEFGNLLAGAVAVEVLFEGRQIPVSSNSFRDSFGVSDVHVYRVRTGG